MLQVFLGKHDSKFICRCGVSSYSSQNVLSEHNERCYQQERTSIETSIESHLYWKKHFHKILFNFGIYAGFEADKKANKSSIGDKRTNSYSKKSGM